MYGPSRFGENLYAIHLSLIFEYLKCQYCQTSAVPIGWKLGCITNFLVFLVT